MSLTEKQKELINELFIEPFMGDLFDQYKDKTLENKTIVEELMEMTKEMKLHFDIISFIEPKIQPLISDPIARTLQAIWMVYHQDDKLKLESVFGNIKIQTHHYEKYCDTKFNDEIVKYYGDAPPKSKEIQGDEFTKEINRCIDFIMDNKNHTIERVVSKKIQTLRKNQGLPYDTSKGTNLSYCDLNSMDFRLRLMQGWVVKNCDFSNAKFKGDGSTGTCLHWRPENCNFTDATFEGKICNKTSKYDGSNFTRVDLTALMYNTGEVTMKQCNFTDAYVNQNGEKLMGKKLLKYLDEIKHIDIAGSLYYSPQDNGYNPNELDPNIWIAI